MSEPTCCNCASECIHAGGPAAHWCIYHTPDHKALEQRYQQLEQVAKELYDRAWSLTLLDMRNGDFDARLKETEEQMRWPREKLEALGVSLDG